MTMTMKTSCSDNGKYPSFCEEASKNAEVFKTFRRHPDYISIVETVSQDDGRKYLQMALQRTPMLEKHLKYFQSSEGVGSPFVYPYRSKWYSKKRLFSPTTLRYIKVLSDLIFLFGNLNQMKIIEIGGGYGGLCKIISDCFSFKRYILVDLKPALDLSRRFLSYFRVPNVEFQSQQDIEAKIPEQFDLVISNYAFTEIRRDIQDIYMEKVLKRSARGYMLCNWKTHSWMNNQVNESLLKEAIPELMIIKNDPAILSQLDLSCGIELAIWGVRQEVLKTNLVNAKNAKAVISH